jgi:hypothetical protein
VLVFRDQCKSLSGMRVLPDRSRQVKCGLCCRSCESNVSSCNAQQQQQQQHMLCKTFDNRGYCGSGQQQYATRRGQAVVVSTVESADSSPTAKSNTTLDCSLNQS